MLTVIQRTDLHTMARHTQELTLALELAVTLELAGTLEDILAQELAVTLVLVEATIREAVMEQTLLEREAMEVWEVTMDLTHITATITETTRVVETWDMAITHQTSSKTVIPSPKVFHLVIVATINNVTW